MHIYALAHLNVPIASFVCIRSIICAV